VAAVFKGHAALYILERRTEKTFAFAVVTTEDGLEYHPVAADQVCDRLYVCRLSPHRVADT
jgi:hypothetical protein